MNKIAIVGCGNMGLIYANSFLKYKITNQENLLLVEKNAERQKSLSAMNLGQVVTTDSPLIKNCEILILAVKPQDFKELAKSLKDCINTNCVVLSIMAGTEISFIEKELNHPLIVRAMPNLPVEISMGMTAYSTKNEIPHDKIMLVENLLSTTGRTLYLKEEQQLNAVTALSGSGPAYFFYFMKSLIDAGIQMGLEEHVASTLAKQTMLGSFHLINSGNKTMDEFISSVASKGGTTEAALSVFNEDKMNETILKALLKAEKRANELAIK